MDPELLNLPLAVKIPVVPGSKPVFCRGKLGEKLHRPFRYFNLDDPYCHHFTPKYNCLHDPHLRDYHSRKDILRVLKREGFVTSDNKVVCTLKEFNEYRQYLTRLKLQSEQFSRRQEEGLLPPLAKSKDSPKLPGTTNTSCQGKHQKPSSQPPSKSIKSGGCRKGRAALDEGQTYPRAELGQEDAKLPRRVRTAADSQRKPDGTASGLLNATFEQPTAAEAKKLEELVKTVVHRVLQKLNIPGNRHVSFLQRAAWGIRERLFGSCMKVELSDTSLDHHQKMQVIAKELVATVLEILGDPLASSTSTASEPGVAARQKEQPVAGRATQADKSKDTGTATVDKALSQTSLDTLTREVVDSVHCTMESFVASQFERETSCECAEIPELPGGNVSNRQLQPSQTLLSQAMEAGQGCSRASGQQSLKAVLPAPAEGAECAKTMEPEDCATVKENLERKMNLEPTASANSLDIGSMANRIADSVFERISQSGLAPVSEENFQGSVPNPATSQGGKESYAAEDTLPSMDP